MATGSLHETETHLLIAQRLSDMSQEETTQLLAQTEALGQIIGGLMRSLRTPNAERRAPH
jgi:four helix bundle protein